MKAIFLLIDLIVFSSWWWLFDRYISIIDRKISNTNEYLIDRFTSIVWKNSIVRQISIIEIVMVALQRACRPWGTTWSNKKEIPVFQICFFRIEINRKCSNIFCQWLLRTTWYLEVSWWDISVVQVFLLCQWFLTK